MHPKVLLQIKPGVGSGSFTRSVDSNERKILVNIEQAKQSTFERGEAINY